MANKRHKPEEIVQKLRQVDVLVGQGVQRVDAIREVRITEQTYYRWRKQYGGMGTDQLKELKRLQKENERLRKAVSDLTLDKLILSVNRAGFAEGAGSQRLLDALLAREGLLRAALTTTERGAETHADLAALIETGEVQCGLGLQSAAGQLGFLPLITDESFDLVMTRRAYFEPPVQRLLAFAKSDAFAKRAAHLGGYDIAQLGDVIWNG